ncbi:uncharacterized protein MYCFIDRAFT_199363 [Pseudocercospora fijiensis CIRAD86]|uniref:PNPLA domain-containing protein n=1 Tax=Pseudocercospora fijiensis (strain CIRAD86) TaxID=383855 RepID=M2YPK2_PSEFD|nr:uncharacterized protein MYCFIDRAFT_199363 [Pseudocercospora fijiensis CIRAD86]EME79670.1 hypothetical protein MYCFIDRAFT_199363 [Pseudocercospora fijiensis CIRAD86]
MIRTRFDEEELEDALREAIDEQLKAEISRTNVSSKSEVPLRNENPDAAQTYVILLCRRLLLTMCSIVVAWGGSQLQDSCLFRSYDHPPPAPNLPDEERYGHLKPYSASPAPIWAVARATSAAPTYFKRIKIGDGEFWDGAVGEGCNNPVRLAYHETKQMHRYDRPAVILSVGTGPRDDKSQDMSRNSFKEMIQLAKQKQWKSSNAEETDYRFRHDILNGVNEALKGEEKIEYERLNPEGISSVKLDTWLPLRSREGKSGGADTKLLMETAVEKYLAKKDVNEALDRTADLLVRKRRKRAAVEDCGRWERFAMHVFYGCPDSVCSTESLFKTRDELREHAFYRHGIVWKIETKHSAKWDDRKYACRWDGCGQKYVPVFETEIDFRDHLERFHKLESPQIMDYDDYEQWLDDGREQGANRSRSNSRDSQISTKGRQTQGIG